MLLAASGGDVGDSWFFIGGGLSEHAEGDGVVWRAFVVAEEGFLIQGRGENAGAGIR